MRIKGPTSVNSKGAFTLVNILIQFGGFSRIQMNLKEIF